MYLHVKCSFRLSTVGIESHVKPRTNSDLLKSITWPLHAPFTTFVRATHDVLYPNFTGAIVTFNRPKINWRVIVIDRCQSLVISCRKKGLKVDITQNS